MKTHTVIIFIDVYFLSLSQKLWNSRPSEIMTASYHTPSNSSFTVLRHCTVYAPDSCRQWFYPSKVRPGYGTAQQAATVTSYAMEKRALRGFFFPSVQTGSGAQPTSYSVSTEGSLTGYEATETWNWQINPIYYRGLKCVVLYFYFRIRLTGTLPTPYLRDSLKDATALQAGRSRVRFPKVSLRFFIDLILPAALWPWGLRSL